MTRTLLLHTALGITLLAVGCGEEPTATILSGPVEAGPDDTPESAGTCVSDLSGPVITVDVTYPDGGETLTYREVVRWTGVHSDSSRFMTASLRIDLHYSDDGGGTWDAIAMGGDNDGTHLWDVRGIPEGTGYLLRVTATDTNGVQGTGVSDGMFGITSRVFITDKKGKKWDITHAIEAYSMEPEGWHQGIGQYAIRPINDPQILCPGVEGYPTDSESFEVVGAYLPNGEARAYPLPMIYYHEVVNDRAGGMPFAAVF